MNNLSIFFRVFALINCKIKRFQCIMSSKAHAYRHHDDLTSTCLQLRFFSLPASTNHPHIQPSLNLVNLYLVNLNLVKYLI